MELTQHIYLIRGSLTTSSSSKVCFLKDCTWKNQVIPKFAKRPHQFAAVWKGRFCKFRDDLILLSTFLKKQTLVVTPRFISRMAVYWISKFYYKNRGALNALDSSYEVFLGGVYCFISSYLDPTLVPGPSGLIPFEWFISNI